MNLNLTNVINVSVAQSQAGIGAYNTSNLGLFTHEPYAVNTFGTAGYKLYLSPDDVATDFGTSSQTYAMALSIFSQSPNILTGGGYLAVIPYLPEQQLISLDANPDAGVMVVNYSGNASAAINYNDTISQIQAKIQAIPGLANAKVTGTIQALAIEFDGVYGNTAAVTITGNTLTHTATPVNAVVSTPRQGEVAADAVTRAVGLVPFFGILFSTILSQAEMLAMAAVVQSMDKLAFVVSRTAADVEVGGMLDLLRSGSLTQTRGLFYGAIGSDAQALQMAAAYAGRALSTNFSGSNTTSTLQLKDLTGIQPDPSMNQTLLAKCAAAGVDVYASLQGVPKVLSSGANRFFDSIYNQLWFVGALKVAAFNFLAQSSTKIPQTESGMDAFRGAHRTVCEQAVANQYAAPGTWNSATTFGNQQDFQDNIKQRGYYIYSAPIGSQLAADRAARKAPLVQIAIKEAGAFHSAAIIVNINQ